MAQPTLQKQGKTSLGKTWDIGPPNFCTNLIWPSGLAGIGSAHGSFKVKERRLRQQW